MHLLDVGHGIPLGKGVRVSLSEDMAHTRAGDDFHGSPTHPCSKGDLCMEGGQGREGGWEGGRERGRERGREGEREEGRERGRE